MTLRWSTSEEESLADIAMNYPPDRLHCIYSKWASCGGYPSRTHKALLAKLRRIGFTCKASGEWLSCGYICKLVGVSRNTPYRWTNQHDVPCHRDGRRVRYFRRSDLRQAAIKKPEIFRGISADQLFLLLEDRDLADQIVALYPRGGKDPRPVRAIETGWRYPSIRSAANRVHITRQAIQHSIRTGGTAAGYHWIYA